MVRETVFSLNSAKRITQTSLAIQRAGLRWVLNRQKPMPVLARETMEDLGATYIKLGQFVASAPSLFPHDYVEAFQDCLDQTTPLSFDVVEKVLQDDFGSELYKVFESIDPVPLASASIAQVHPATLRSGENVVVKVQKPGVKEILETDFQFMQFSAWMMEKLSIANWNSSLSDMVEEIRNGMVEECNFLQEAENVEAYRRFLNAANIVNVKVPKVYHQATTEHVLTMERFYGVPLTDINKVREFSEDPEQALVDALHTWFMSLMQCQIYHADLHSGNVMLLEDGSVGFIDFGIVGKITPKTWEALVSLTVTIPAQDFQGIAMALMTIGVTKDEVNVDEFASDLENLWLQISGTGEDYIEPESYLKDLMMDLSSLSSHHGIRFPREFTLLIKQFLYFDRYIRILAPELEIFSDDRIGLGVF